MSTSPGTFSGDLQTIHETAVNVQSRLTSTSTAFQDSFVLIC